MACNVNHVAPAIMLGREHDLEDSIGTSLGAAENPRAISERTDTDGVSRLLKEL